LQRFACFCRNSPRLLQVVDQVAGRGWQDPQTLFITNTGAMFHRLTQW
jgi:hypothetical protein